MSHAPHQSSVTLEALLAASECDTHDDAERSFLLFESRGTVYGVDAACVESIDEAGVIAPLPYPPSAVVGVASVRGAMRLVVYLGEPSSTARGRLVSLSNDRNVAIHADRVLGVVTVDANELDSTASGGTRKNQLHIDGHDVSLVDPTSLIGP